MKQAEPNLYVALGQKGEVLERVSFPTTTPEETMAHVISFFEGKGIEALGVGSFGPIDPIEASPTYGYITTTPKPHWGQYNMIGKLKEHFDVPMTFDTDVNGAALGEATWGAAQGLDSCLYITVGTASEQELSLVGKWYMDCLIPRWGISSYGDIRKIHTQAFAHIMKTV